MELKEIAEGLAAKFANGELAVADGEVAVEIDGMPILIAEGRGDAIVLTGLVGDPPAEGGEAFANLMLEATMGLMDSKSAALARNPETGSYALVQRVQKGCMTLESFCGALEEFVDALESWREMLESFRPAAASAAAKDKEAPNSADMALNGFLQV